MVVIPRRRASANRAARAFGRRARAGSGSRRRRGCAGGWSIASIASRSAAVRPLLAPKEWMKRRSWPFTLTTRVWLVACVGSTDNEFVSTPWATSVSATKRPKASPPTRPQIEAERMPSFDKATAALQAQPPMFRISSSTGDQLARASGIRARGGQRWSATTTPAQITGTGGVEAIGPGTRLIGGSSRLREPRPSPRPTPSGIVQRGDDLVTGASMGGAPARRPIISSISETVKTSRSIRASVRRSSSSRFFARRRKARSSASRRMRATSSSMTCAVCSEWSRHLAHLAADERVLVRGAERDRADPLAHAPLRHHPPGEPGRLLQVHRGAGGLVVVDEALGGASAQQHAEAGEHLALAVAEAIFLGQELGDAQRPASGDDRDLVDGVGVGVSQATRAWPTS